MEQEMTIEQLKEMVKSLERKTAELRWEQKKAYLMQHCLDNANDVIFWVDKNANIIFANSTAEQKLGYPRNELLAKKIFHLILWEKENSWSDFYQNVLDHGRLVEKLTGKTSQENEFKVEVTASPLQYQDKEVVLLYVHDFGEQKEIEDSLTSIKQENTEHLAELNKKLESVNAQIAEEKSLRLETEEKLASSSQEYSERLSDLESELESVRGKHRSEKSDKKDLEEKLVSERDEMEQKIVVLDNDLEGKKQECDSIKNQLELEITKFRDEKKILDAAYQKCDEQLTGQNKELQGFRDKLEGECAARQAMEEQLDSTQPAFELVAKANDELVTVMTKLDDEVIARKELKESLNLVRNELEQTGEEHKLEVEKFIQQIDKQEAILLAQKKETEEALLWSQKEGAQHLATQEQQVAAIQEQLDREIKVKQKIETELASSRMEAKQGIQKFEKELQALHDVLERKEKYLKQLHQHHKNTLEVLATFFTSKAHKAKKKKRQLILEKHKNVIKLHSFIQEKMYQAQYPLQECGNVLLGDIVEIVQSYDLLENENVNCIISGEKVLLSTDRAITCGLIIHELLENGFQHAFKEDKGEVLVTIQKLSALEIELSVKDSGSGLAKQFEIEKLKTLGLPFVSLLVEQQLQGTVEIKVSEGTEFVIRFSANDEIVL